MFTVTVQSLIKLIVTNNY